MLAYLLRRIKGNTDEALSGVYDHAEAVANLKIQAETVNATVNPSGMSFNLGPTQFIYAPIALEEGESVWNAVDRWNDIEPTWPSHAVRDGSRAARAATVPLGFGEG